ncbi:MAG: alpha/beta fold hydrolase [Lysobacterales bacterium]
MSIQRQPEALTLRAADGTRIAALRYRAHEVIGRIVVAGATGVPQRFYRAFAEHAAERGYTTLTLDYRGIGMSKPETLRGFRMNYLDWAHQDLSAAVAAMPDDGLPLYMVGHSFGGHAFGLLPNHQRIAAFYTFATGAGWHGWMPPAEQVRVRFLWNVLAPLLTRWHGFLSLSKLGMGEDLPYGVYRDWKRWCSYPRYFFDDPAVAADMIRRFDQVRTPITAANAVDDLWATPASRDAFMSGYRNAPVQRIDLDPRQHGLKGIGHMGYFRREAQPLWDEVLAWFARSPLVSAA